MKTYGRRRSTDGTSQNQPLLLSPSHSFPSPSRCEGGEVSSLNSGGKDRQYSTMDVLRSRSHTSQAAVSACPLGSLELASPGLGAVGEPRLGNRRQDCTVMGTRRLWKGTTTSGKKRRRQDPKGQKDLKSKKRAAQMFLDFGQKDFGKQVLCPNCDMLYVLGAGVDEVQHSAMCAHVSRGVEFAGWAQERVAARFPDDGGRVVEVRPGDPLPHLQKVEEVKRVMDNDMGFALVGPSGVRAGAGAGTG
ncbi:unnamed protein product, partial [Discosporangium mesarthrocarpum]